jgi:uncharacterized integral membrane protein (TIGR00698 family)
VKDVQTLRPSASAASAVPGLLAAVAVAVVATGAGIWIPILGAPVLAIVIGIVVASLRPLDRKIGAGLHSTTRVVLQVSIVLLGFNLTLGRVVSIGGSSLPVLIGTLVAALVVARFAGRRLGLGSDLTTLIGIGTAVCGASAIAAVDSAIDADDGDVSYAVSVIFLFNVVAVILYPLLGHLLQLSQHSFGLFAGTAINDTSSVVAASKAYGQQAAAYGVVVKLTRTLAIVPICVGLVWLRRPHGRDATAGTATTNPGLARLFPRFVIGFLVAAAANSAGIIPARFDHALSTLATALITVALAGVGLSFQLDRIRRTGPRPVILGAVLWATVGVTSLALQAAAGAV